MTTYPTARDQSVSELVSKMVFCFRKHDTKPEDCAYLIALVKAITPGLTSQEIEDIGAAATTQYAANVLRRMVRVIPSPELSKESILDYAQEVEGWE